MIVRDRTRPASFYKGRPTEARDDRCPCRPCFNAHDCGYSAYGGHVVAMECATRWNSGCPRDGDDTWPVHIFKSDRARACKRCGVRR